MDELTKAFPNVWCPICEAVHPLLIVEKESNKHRTADLLCSRCWTVVATLHAAIGQLK